MKPSRAAFAVGGVALAAATVFAVVRLTPKTAGQRSLAAASTEPTTTTTTKSGTGIRPGAAATSPSGTPTPTARPLSQADITTLAGVRVTVANGPGIPQDGDPGIRNAPTARELGVYERLPLDWAQAFALGVTTINALATPQADRGTTVQANTSNDLYAQWLRTVQAKPSTATFTLRTLYLAGAEGATTDEMKVIGVGDYVDRSTKTSYLATATLTRGRNGWFISAAKFEPIGEGN